MVERTLRGAARGTDVVTTGGRGRFRIVLPSTGEFAARAYLRRIRATIEPRLEAADRPLRLAVATATVLDEPIEDAVRRAERPAVGRARQPRSAEPANGPSHVGTVDEPNGARAAARRLTAAGRTSGSGLTVGPAASRRLRPGGTSPGRPRWVTIRTSASAIDRPRRRASIACSARSGPTTTGSRHVDATTARTDRPAGEGEQEQPPVRPSKAPAQRRSSAITTTTIAVASPSRACDGIDGMAGPSEPHGPGPR